MTYSICILIKKAIISTITATFFCFYIFTSENGEHKDIFVYKILPALVEYGTQTDQRGFSKRVSNLFEFGMVNKMTHKWVKNFMKSYSGQLFQGDAVSCFYQNPDDLTYGGEDEKNRKKLWDLIRKFANNKNIYNVTMGPHATMGPHVFPDAIIKIDNQKIVSLFPFFKKNIKKNIKEPYCFCIKNSNLEKIPYLQDFSSASNLTIEYNNFLAFLDLSSCEKLVKLELYGLDNLKEIILPKSDTLESIDIQNCFFLESLDLSGCKKLDNLELRNKLYLKEIIFPKNSVVLKHIFIESCHSLESLDLSSCEKLVNLILYYLEDLKKITFSESDTLEYINIRDCDLLKSLDLSSCKNLVNLKLYRLDNLSDITLPESDTLEYINIRDCDSLEFLDLSLCNNSVELELNKLDNLQEIIPPK